MVMAVFSFGVAWGETLVLEQTMDHWGSPSTVEYQSDSDGTLVFTITNNLGYDKSHAIYYGMNYNYGSSTSVTVPANGNATVEVPISAGLNSFWLSDGDWGNPYVVTLKGGSSTGGGGGEQGGGQTTTRPSTLTEAYTFSIAEGATNVTPEQYYYLYMKFPNVKGSNEYATIANVKGTFSDGTNIIDVTGSGPASIDGASIMVTLEEAKTYTLTITDVKVEDYANNSNVLVDAYNAEGLATLTFSTAGPAADGTMEHPYILTAEGVAGPQAASGPSDYTYYKYIAEEAGVVSISNDITKSIIGGISVNGGNYSYRPSGNFVAEAGDVFMVRIAAQGDCTSNTMKATWRALQDGETPATAKNMKEGVNDIAMVDNQNGAISNWYKLSVPANTTATVTFSSANIVAKADGENIVLDENRNWIVENNSASAKDVMIEVSGTNGMTTITAFVSFEQGVAAKFTHLGDVAWSVQNNNLPKAASYITVTFPNAKGGEETTPVKLENVYIFDANENSAPLNLDGTSEFSGNLGNGVNIYYQFAEGKKYRVQIGNVTVNGSHFIPNADENNVGNGTIEFTVGEQQQVEAKTIDLCDASMNGVSSCGTLNPMSRYVDITEYEPGLTKVADASKISFTVYNKDYPNGWAADVANVNVYSVNGNVITLDLGSGVADLLTYEGDWTLAIQAGALSDNSGNITNNEAYFTWTCGTAAAAPKAPTFVSATNNGIAPTEVKTLSNQFVVTFSENVQEGYSKPYLYYNGLDNSWQATDAVYDGKTVTYTFADADLTKNGTYRLSLTYGIVANAADASLMFEGYYDSNIEWSINPNAEDPEPGITEDFDLEVINGNDTPVAPGEYAEKLNWYFYMQVPKGTEVDMDVFATLTKDGNEFSTARAGMMDETTAYLSFRNAAPDYIEEAGSYTLTIPAGMFKNGNYKNTVFTATWDVVPAESENFIIDNVLNGGALGVEAGEVTELNQQFTILLGTEYQSTGSGAITITKDGVLYGGNGSLTAYPGMTEIYVKFNFNSTKPITTPGVYTLTIPAGILIDADGKTNAEWTGTWTVIEAAHAIDTEVATPGAAQGLDELDNVFTLSGEDWDVIGEATPYMQISRNGDITTVNGVASVVDGIATITFPEKFTKGGTYTLMVPASTFFDIDGNYNGLCNSTWTVYGKADAFTGYQALNISEAGFMDAEQMANGVKVELPNANDGDYVNAELYNAEGQKLSEGAFIIDEMNVATFKFDNELQAGNDYVLKLISIADAEGTVTETPETVEISFSILKPVIRYSLGEVQFTNIANGKFNGNEADGVVLSLINGEGYDKTATVVVRATLNDGEEETFNGTPESVALFAGKLADGENTIVIASVEVFVDEAPVVGMPYGETIEKTFTVDSNATGINAIAAQAGNAAMYNVAGQRINVAKGIVIINGKKYQVK